MTRFRYTVSSQLISGSPIGSFLESLLKTLMSVCGRKDHPLLAPLRFLWPSLPHILDLFLKSPWHACSAQRTINRRCPASMLPFRIGNVVQRGLSRRCSRPAASQILLLGNQKYRYFNSPRSSWITINPRRYSTYLPWGIAASTPSSAGSWFRPVGTSRELPWCLHCPAS